MTPEQQEMLAVAHAARDSGFKRVEIAPEDLIALLDRIAELERENAGLSARVEELSFAEITVAGMDWG
jgi:uncharacterized protein (UPF0335 family)